MEQEYITISYDAPNERPILQIVNDDGNVLFECEIVEEKIPVENLQ